MKLKGGLWAHWPVNIGSLVDSCGARGGEVVGAKEPLWVAVVGWHVDTGIEAGCDVVEGIHSGS